jgi:hypothetical protein
VTGEQSGRVGKSYEGSSRLFTLFRLWWERKLEGESWRLGLARCIVGRREDSLVVDSRPRTEFKDGEHLHTAGEGARQAQVVRDEGSSWSSKMFELGANGYGMGIKSRHWVTFKHRIRCTMFRSVVSIGEQSGKERGTRVGVTRSPETTRRRGRGVGAT